MSLSVSIFNTIAMFIGVIYYGAMGIIVAIVITKFLAAILSLCLLQRIKDEDEV